MTSKYGIKNTPPVEATSISAFGCLMQNGVILHQGALFSILLRERYQIRNEKIEKNDKICTFLINSTFRKKMLKLQQINFSFHYNQDWFLFKCMIY